jgi:hypothetical protein
VITTEDWHGRIGLARLEAARDLADTEDAVCGNFAADAFQSSWTDRLQVEGRPQKTSRRFADQHCTRHGERLQSGCQVRSLTDNPPLLCLAGAGQIADDDEPGADPDANLKLGSQAQLHRRDSFDQRQTGSDRSLAIVLVRLRIAEISQYSIAHIFGDKSLETRHCLGHTSEVRTDYNAKILRIEARGQRGRVDEVAE